MDMDDGARTRGFVYDELTEADDAQIERMRCHLYSVPCGNGTWVSVDGRNVYQGNGGSEREQEFWFDRGPWIKLVETELERMITRPLLNANTVLKTLNDSLLSDIRDLAAKYSKE